MLRNRALKILAGVALSAALVTASPAAPQQRHSAIQIQHGRVIAARSVQPPSQAGGAAVLGGAVGYATASGKSKSTKWRNAVIGSAVAGGAKAASEAREVWMEYAVETTGGTQVRIVTNQTQVRVGDCVAVEQSGSAGNIRRVSDVVCQPAAQEVVTSVEDEFQEEAAECLAAKEGLLAAETDDEIDRAVRKISILCDN